MKTISLWQPYATLIAIGAKEYETRHWASKYRGEIAIHAAKTWVAADLFYQEPFNSVLRAAGYGSWDDLPFGSIVAIGKLTYIFETAKLYPKIGEQERKFGDYRAGRYAWRIQNVVRVEPPIQVSGKQGLWNWDNKRPL